MEFWGVEVKPNQTVRCEPGDEKLLRLSLAALGESKKATENVVTYVTFHNQKLIIGTLSSEKCAQISHDLVFEKEFELSHSSKNASVYFIGYKTGVLTDEDPSDFDDSESEEEEEVDDALKVKSNSEKVERKAKVKALKANMVEQDADDDDDDDDDSDDDDYGGNDGDDSDDEEMVEAEDSDDEDDEDDDNDDDEDDNSEEDEETPKKAAKGKKKPAEPVTKGAVSEKKAKLASPTDGKKGGDAKKDSPTKSGKKEQTPKSSSSVSCKSCSKTFYSEGALDSHTKAKHAAK